jgi:hypothetical protein
MAVLTFPNITSERQDFGVRYSTQVHPSRLNGIIDAVELPGARWRGSLGFSDMTPLESADLKAFLLELRGAAGTFFYGDITHTTPFNAVTGSPTIAGASTESLIRVTLGSSSPEFSTGDYIQIGTDDQRELKMILSSTVVSGDTYDLAIEPVIRRTDYVGLSVVYTNPKGVFMLTTDEQAFWSTRSKALLSDINIEFIEVFM